MLWRTCPFRVPDQTVPPEVKGDVSSDPSCQVQQLFDFASHHAHGDKSFVLQPQDATSQPVQIQVSDLLHRAVQLLWIPTVSCGDTNTALVTWHPVKVSSSLFHFYQTNYKRKKKKQDSNLSSKITELFSNFPKLRRHHLKLVLFKTTCCF